MRMKRLESLRVQAISPPPIIPVEAPQKRAKPNKKKCKCLTKRRVRRKAKK